MAVAELPNLSKNGKKNCAQTDKATAHEYNGDLLEKLVPSDFRAEARRLVSDLRGFCDASGGALRYSQKESINGNVLMVSVNDGGDKESYNEFKIHIYPTGKLEFWKKAYFHATKEKPITVSGIVHENDFILSEFVKGMNFRGKLGFGRAKSDRVFETVRQELVKQHPELPARTAETKGSRPSLIPKNAL